MTKRLRSSLLLLLLASLGACGDETNPSEDVTGHYQATTFTITRVGIPPLDVLAAGGSMTLELTEDGRAAGNVFIPQALTDDPQDFEVILVGTYTRSGDTVHLQHNGSVDSFLELVDWGVVSPNKLGAIVTDQDGEGRIDITLTKD
jgi:hypothetical protein